MWEGQATSRRAQVIAGLFLAVVSLPFASLGAFGLWICIVKNDANLAIFTTLTVALLVGLLGLTIAYRMVRARGVRQGGGIMSPLAFSIGGVICLAFAAFLTYDALASGKYWKGIGIIFPLFLSFIFFVAARHRGAMRRIQ
jgi:hypothetical protein